jgi:hypothetical protein
MKEASKNEGQRAGKFYAKWFNSIGVIARKSRAEMNGI